ncbi:MAG: hypothetical protein LBC10_02265 [Deltaproteobacteria bacterium]|jgi:predicted aldo/keto reductase-like oxidoreductase|nr:hypothetical protein [Deltaproteobacteria bacterium]
MDSNHMQQLRLCLACQNPCRILFPAGLQPKESSTCSPMAALAYSVLEGNVAFTPDVAARLADTEGCKACSDACPYKIDVASLAGAVAAEAQRAARELGVDGLCQPLSDNF